MQNMHNYAKYAYNRHKSFRNFCYRYKTVTARRDGTPSSNYNLCEPIISRLMWKYQIHLDPAGVDTSKINRL